MNLTLTFCGIIALVVSVLIISLSAEDEGGTWYSRLLGSQGFGLNSLLDLTSSTSPVASAVNTAIGQKNVFTAFTTFLNQTRRVIPTVATFGNFTLLQAALVCAVGAIATGAATFAAEAYYFKITNDQKKQQDAYHNHYAAQLPSIVYGNNQNHFRRNYDVEGTGNYMENTQTRKSNRPNPYQELQRRYPPKTLKRNQRRNQRKNKNSADQLDKLFPAG